MHNLNENIEYLRQKKQSQDFDTRLELLKTNSGIIQTIDYYEIKVKKKQEEGNIERKEKEAKLLVQKMRKEREEREKYK